MASNGNDNNGRDYHEAPPTENYGKASKVYEGQSTNRPPLFNGSNFSYWKTRMEAYLSGVGLGDYLYQDYTPPTEPIRLLWKKEDHEAFMANAKAMTAFHCALDHNEFRKICNLKTAKKI